MKRTLQTLAIVLALGAIAQTLAAYAYDAEIFSADEEEVKLIQLIELRKTFVENKASLNINGTLVDPRSRQITSSDQLNEAIVRQTLRYLQAIGAEGALVKAIKQPNFQLLMERMEPGI